MKLNILIFLIFSINIVFAREILLDQNTSIEIKSLKLIEDGGFYVTGVNSNTKGAWIAKFSMNEKEVWRDEFVNQVGIQKTIINDIAPTSNKIYACGNVFYANNAQAPTLKIYDSDGTIRKEMKFSSDVADRFLPAISNCAVKSENLIGVGSVVRINAKPPPIWSTEYLFISRDLIAEAGVQKILPSSLSQVDEISIIDSTESEIIFVGKNNNATEVVKVSKNGDVVVRRLFKSKLLQLRSTRAWPLKLISQNSDESLVVFSLDSNLNIIKKREFPFSSNIYLSNAWELPDESIFIFGDAEGALEGHGAAIGKIENGSERVNRLNVRELATRSIIRAALYDEKNHRFLIGRTFYDSKIKKSFSSVIFFKPF